MEDARSKMNHAIGKSRGIKCGDNYNCIEEIKSDIPKQTVGVKISKVDDKSGEQTVLEKSQDSTKSTKKKSY